MYDQAREMDREQERIQANKYRYISKCTEQYLYVLPIISPIILFLEIYGLEQCFIVWVLIYCLCIVPICTSVALSMCMCTLGVYPCIYYYSIAIKLSYRSVVYDPKALFKLSVILTLTRLI